LAAAKAAFRLDRFHGGATAREHLEAIEARTGKRPTELDEAEIPDQLAHVWNWFTQLNAARSGNGYGPNPISYTEIASWASLTGAAPTSFEVLLIRAIDALCMAEANREQKRKAAA